MLHQLHEQRTDKKMSLNTYVKSEHLETLLGATGEFYIFCCQVLGLLLKVCVSVIFFAFEPHNYEILNTNSGTVVPEKQHFFCTNTLQSNFIPVTADTIA
jgi:hypothetical protein